MDEDGDGKINIAEAKKYGITVTLFQKLDTDNSGFLTQRELEVE
jgi:Ca2+-binding EF-hand superfamily protein